MTVLDDILQALRKSVELQIDLRKAVGHEPIPPSRLRGLTEVRRADEARVGPGDAPEAALFTEDAPPKDLPLGEEFVGRALRMFEEETPPAWEPEATRITDLSPEPARAAGDVDRDVVLRVEYVDRARGRSGHVDFYEGVVEPSGFQTYETMFEIRNRGGQPSIRLYDDEFQ